MSRMITTNDGTQYQKAGFLKTSNAIGIGSTAQGAILLGSSMVGLKCTDKMRKLNFGENISQIRATLNSPDTPQIRTALHDALKASGMEAKGVKIIDYSGQKAPSIPHYLKSLFHHLTYYLYYFFHLS